MTAQHGRCPDRGTCHHDCVRACFRVRYCGPLSNVFPGDEWPEDVRKRNEVLAQPRPERIQWRRDEWWSGRIGRVGDVDLFRITAPNSWGDYFSLESPLLKGVRTFPFKSNEDGPMPKGIKRQRAVLTSEIARHGAAEELVKAAAERILEGFARSVLEPPQQEGS